MASWVSGSSSASSSARNLTRERRRHADVLQLVVVVVQPEQQRADAVAVLVDAVAGDDALGRALVLDLDERPLVRQVRVVEALGDDAVEAGALEAPEPLGGRVPARARRREVDGGAGRMARSSASRRSASGRSSSTSSPRARRSKATNDAGVSAARRRTRDSAGWMRCSRASKSRPRPSRSATTISPSTTQRCGQRGPQRVEQLGEVAGERPLVAAGQLDVVAVAEHDAAEAVPLRLEQPAVAVGDRAGQLGQHRLERRGERQDHARILARPGTAARRATSNVQRPIGRPNEPDKEPRHDVTLEHRPGLGRRGGSRRRGRDRARRRRASDDAGATVPDDSVPDGRRAPTGRASGRSRCPATAPCRSCPTSPPSRPACRRTADTAAEAMDTVGTKSQALVDTLKGVGIAEEDIQTSGLNLWPTLRQRRLDDQRLPGVDERHRHGARRRRRRRGARRACRASSARSSRSAGSRSPTTTPRPCSARPASAAIDNARSVPSSTPRPPASRSARSCGSSSRSRADAGVRPGDGRRHG